MGEGPRPGRRRPRCCAASQTGSTSGEIDVQQDGHPARPVRRRQARARARGRDRHGERGEPSSRSSSSGRRAGRRPDAEGAKTGAKAQPPAEARRAAPGRDTAGAADGVRVLERCDVVVDPPSACRSSARRSVGPWHASSAVFACTASRRAFFHRHRSRTRRARSRRAWRRPFFAWSRMQRRDVVVVVAAGRIGMAAAAVEHLVRGGITPFAVERVEEHAPSASTPIGPNGVHAAAAGRGSSGTLQLDWPRRDRGCGRTRTPDRRCDREDAGGVADRKIVRR